MPDDVTASLGGYGFALINGVYVNSGAVVPGRASVPQSLVDAPAAAAAGASPVTGYYQQRHATPRGGLSVGSLGSSATAPDGNALLLDDGSTLLVLTYHGKVRSGLNPGTYQVEWLLDLDGDVYVLGSSSGPQNADFGLYLEGTEDDPVFEVTNLAGKDVPVRWGWRNLLASPGTLANATHHARAAYLVR